MNIRRLVILAWRSWKEFGYDNCSQMSAALAYYILFSIVPLTMFFVSVLGMLAGTEQVQQRLADAISERLDASTADVTLELTTEGEERLEDSYGADSVVDVTEELERLNADDSASEERSDLASATLGGQDVVVAGYTLTSDDLDVHYDNIVLETISGVVAASTTLTFVSLLILGFAATGLFGAVRRSLDFVWDVPRHRDPVRGKLLDAAFLLMLLTLLILALVVLLLLSIATSIALRVLGADESGGVLGQILWNIATFLVPLALVFIVFLVLYRFGPRTHNRFRDIWFGALLSAFGFQVLTFGYAIYVTNFSSYDAVYGALGGVLLFLFFTYLSGFIFLYGAEVASEYPEVVRGDHDELFDQMVQQGFAARDEALSTARRWLRRDRT